MKDDLLLRHVEADDLPIFFEHQRDPVANQMAAFPPREREAFMEHWKKIAVDEAAITRTIVFDGHVVGNVVSWIQDGERAVGYWIGREFWGKGIATRALSELLVLLTIRPLYAHVAKQNPASLRVLQKCGFVVSAEARIASESGDIDEYILKLC